MSKKIAVIGECMIELSQKGAEVSRGFGGDTLNTAVYIARQVAPEALTVNYVTALGTDSFSQQMLEAWQNLIQDLRTDLWRAADRVDWIAKLQVLESYRRRDGLDWSAPLLGMIDLQYHDLRAEKGLYYKLARAGRMRRLFTDEQISWAAVHPPEETRAWLRGTLVKDHADVLAGAGWDQVLLRTDPVTPPHRLALADPLGGRRIQAEPVLRQEQSAEELISGLDELLSASS